jgi:hypothetical protein
MLVPDHMQFIDMTGYGGPEVLTLTSGRAAARLSRLIDSGSERVEATRFSLGVAGIKPAADAQVNVNIELKAGYVIDLSERDEPAAKIVGGQWLTTSQPTIVDKGRSFFIPSAKAPAAWRYSPRSAAPRWG